MKEIYNAFELNREMTEQERVEMRRLFGDDSAEPVDASAYHQERAKQFHEDTQRRGLEALVKGDKDILKTIECLDIASKNDKDNGLTYAILDIDNMSEINMKYGKQVGNLVIKYVREVANHVLMDKSHYVGKPSIETPESKGDQLFLILNHAYLPQEDLDNLIDIIKKGVATRVYDELRMNFRSIPARWKNIEDEEISVTIGYTAVRDARIYKQQRGEEKCTTATLLRESATRSLKIAKVQTKKKGSGTAYGLN